MRFGGEVDSINNYSAAALTIRVGALFILAGEM